MIRLAYRLFLFFVVSLTMVSCSENYSRGEKVGTVIEFAQSGLIWDSWDGRLNLTQQVVAEVKKYFPKKVLGTVIPRSVRLSEAPSFGMPVMYYDKSGKGSIAYMNLAKEIIQKN